MVPRHCVTHVVFAGAESFALSETVSAPSSSKYLIHRCTVHIHKRTHILPEPNQPDNRSSSLAMLNEFSFGVFTHAVNSLSRWRDLRCRRSSALMQ